MGAYCTYFYNGLYLDSTKNDIDVSILKIIEDTDIYKSTCDEVYPYIKEHFNICDGYCDEVDDCIYTFVKVEKKLLIDRLSILGYDLEFTKEMFNIFLEEKIKEYTDPKYDFMKVKLEILKVIEFDIWLDKLKFIQTNSINKFEYEDEYETSDPLLHYMLTNDWYGFEGFDICIFLRLLMEISDDGEFVCDFTDLLLSEYIDNEYINDTKERYFKNDKIIVLTEGKSDIEILSRSLKLLYPHMFSYFAFMDFDNAKIGGGVGPLTSIVKSFAGVGISNKVIAIFDNDTAAKSATKQLERISLPSNIKTYYLPVIERLKNYPTIGPTGLKSMDINNIAGSIEMYLGHDALFDKESQSYYPIQWKGYDAGQQQYQGEIIEKDTVQKNFLNILDECEKDFNQITNYDFEDMKLVLGQLFIFFAKFEQELMKEEYLEYIEK